jgi:hypothetical protein
MSELECDWLSFITEIDVTSLMDKSADEPIDVIKYVKLKIQNKEGIRKREYGSRLVDSKEFHCSHGHADANEMDIFGAINREIQDEKCIQTSGILFKIN